MNSSDGYYIWQGNTSILLLFSHSVMSNSLQPHRLFFTISWSLLKLRSIELMMPFNHLIFCHPLFLLPSIFPSIRDFYNESAVLTRWPKYWDFSFSISPSNDIKGWLPLGLTGLISLPSKGLWGVFSSTTVWRLRVFIALPSLQSSPHNCLTVGKTLVLTIWIRCMCTLPRFGDFFPQVTTEPWVESPRFSLVTCFMYGVSRVHASIPIL